MGKFKKYLNQGIRLFSAFDMFGKGVEFLIDGSSMNKTFIGAIVSITCLAFSIILSATTIQNFIYGTSPTIESTYWYDTTSIPMNKDNFFFSIGFFAPVQGKLTITNEFNNYTSLLNISNINVVCHSCKFNVSDAYYKDYYKSAAAFKDSQGDSNSTNSLASFSPEPPDFLGAQINSSNFYLVNCNTSSFNNVRIKSLAAKRTQDIVNIMKSYSYCFPPTIKGNITDGSQNGYDESLIINLLFRKTQYIPPQIQGKLTSGGSLINKRLEPPSRRNPKGEKRFLPRQDTEFIEKNTRRRASNK